MTGIRTRGRRKPPSADSSKRTITFKWSPGAFPALSARGGSVRVRVWWAFALPWWGPAAPGSPLGLPCPGLAVVGRSNCASSPASARDCGAHSSARAWFSLRGWCAGLLAVVLLLVSWVGCRGANHKI